MDVWWMYPNPILILSEFDIIRNIRQKSDISDIIRIRKSKVPIENIKNLFILLNTNYKWC
jgi:hypothetical protein